MGNAIWIYPLEILSLQQYQINFWLMREYSWFSFLITGTLCPIGIWLLKDLTAFSNNHICTNNKGCCSPFSPCHFSPYLFHTFQLSHKKKGLWDITSQSEYSFPYVWQTSREQCVGLTFRSLALLTVPFSVQCLGATTSSLLGKLQYLFLVPLLMWMLKKPSYTRMLTTGKLKFHCSTLELHQYYIIINK